MTVIAVVGDCATTTALALISAWPNTEDAVLVEADRSGGSLAAWLDTPITPSLSTIVANSHTLDAHTLDAHTLGPHTLGNAPASTAWDAIDPMIHRSTSGVRFISCPVRSREANRSIAEAESVLFPMFAHAVGPPVIADLGSFCAADAPPRLASFASSVLLCHRQSAVSVAAASVRLERLAEAVETLSTGGVPLIVVLIGDRPFDGEEVQRFVTPTGHPSIPIYVLPIDDLTAAVFAGRTGVSKRRLNRLPLMRSARGLVNVLRETTSIGPATTGGSRAESFGADEARPVPQ